MEIIDIGKLTKAQRAVLNVVIMGSITFVSSLATFGVPTIETLWASMISSILATLIQLNHLLASTPSSKERKEQPKLLIGTLI